MNRRIILLFFIFTVLLETASAQVSVNTKIDSIEILIGEQTNVTLSVRTPENSKVEMPRFQGGVITPGILLVGTSVADTTDADNHQKIVTQIYCITSFDERLYYLPPFTVKVDGKPYKSNSLALKVLTVNVDTLHKDSFFGPKDVVNNPFSWSDWSGLFWLCVIAMLLLAVSYYLYTRYRDNKPIIVKPKIIERLLPHQKAMREIERIKADKVWASENSKSYYTELTDTLRKYIEERYGFNAMEMTSSEIIDRLSKVNDQKAIDELRELFTTADLVKFAKYNTLINENDMNLVTAIEYINKTKIEVDPNAAPIKEKVSEEELRGRKASLALKLTITVLTVVAALSFAYVVWQAFELLR